MTTRALASGLLLDEDRRIGPIWRAILFVALTVFVAMPLMGKLLDAILGPQTPGPFRLDPANLALAEAFNFVCGLIVVGLFALYEHRRIDTYGMPLRDALKSPTWETWIVGVAQTTVVALAMFDYGAMQVRGLAPSGLATVWSGLAWLGACICLGIAEEFLFRGYFLQTLWKAIGFWPAAGLVAAIFAGLHCLLKPGENVWDILALVSFTLVCCYSVLRTGNLWFAVGFH